jgi:hypothetical protein
MIKLKRFLSFRSFSSHTIFSKSSGKFGFNLKMQQKVYESIFYRTVANQYYLLFIHATLELNS